MRLCRNLDQSSGFQIAASGSMFQGFCKDLIQYYFHFPLTIILVKVNNASYCNKGSNLSRLTWCKFTSCYSKGVKDIPDAQVAF